MPNAIFREARAIDGTHAAFIENTGHIIFGALVEEIVNLLHNARRRAAALSNRQRPRNPKGLGMAAVQSDLDENVLSFPGEGDVCNDQTNQSLTFPLRRG